MFLKRYPTTPTNRNRARSRWTYYHFLGLDIEKSASRTTDPVALADTDNPTMKNPACTVCHRVMDPVAGTFQNYGEEGEYRDEWGGLDSLDDFYKYPPDGSYTPYQYGDTWYRDMREPGFDGEVAPDADNSLQVVGRTDRRRRPVCRSDGEVLVAGDPGRRSGGASGGQRTTPASRRCYSPQTPNPQKWNDSPRRSGRASPAGSLTT